MNKKEFHIISVGISILTNAQRAGLIPREITPKDNEKWKQILDDPTQLQKIIDFVKQDPKKHSAELNTFLRVTENKDPRSIEVYPFGTKTYSNEICRKAIESFLKEKGYLLYVPTEISGYFWELKEYDEQFARDEFQRGISALLDRLIYLATKKKEEGYHVFFNATGGFKAHVIVNALGGFLTNSQVYYMNEEFQDVVFLPNLFYLPKGKEIDLLKILSDKKPRSGQECKNLCAQYKNEVERLKLYGLIELESEDPYSPPYRIQITNKGQFILNTLLENYESL